MFKITRYLLSFGTLAAALLLAASHASAQQSTFSLPFQAQIGGAKLRPGTYRMHLPTPTTSVRVVYLDGDNKVQAVLPRSIDYDRDASGRSYLELVNIRGMYFVEKFVSGLSGATCRFAVPKMPISELMAKKTYIPVTDRAAN